MENNWQNELGKLLNNEIHLKETSEYLMKLKDVGVNREEIGDYLQKLRAGSVELVEDRILEILDIVEGYCNPIYRVW